MPPTTKRSAGSGAPHEDESSGAPHQDESGRRSFPAAGQSKAAANKKQRKDSTDGSLLKNEWRELSQSAQSRHMKNEVRARIRAMIPGPSKVSENGLMLQAASRIKELEIEVDSLSSCLERLQKLQSSNGSTDNNLKEDQSEAAGVSEIQQAKDGNEALREALPQPTKAKGRRLLESAWQYLTELVQERDQLVEQIVELEHQGCTEARVCTPPDCEK